MLFYSISVHVKNYKAEEFLQSIESISQQIRKNKNCLDLKIYKDLENSENYNILSTWNDEDSLRVFMKRNENKILEGAASVLGERVERIFAVTKNELGFYNEIDNIQKIYK